MAGGAGGLRLRLGLRLGNAYEKASVGGWGWYGSSRRVISSGVSLTERAATASSRMMGLGRAGQRVCTIHAAIFYGPQKTLTGADEK